MKAMEILKRCRDAREDLARLELKLSQRRSAADSMGSPMGGSGRHGSGPSDKVGNIAADIADLEAQKQEREYARSVEIASACALLDMVPIRESEVLYGYWVEGKTTTQVAKGKHYTVAYVRRIKRDGERQLDMLTEERVNSTLPRWYLERYGGRE